MHKFIQIGKSITQLLFSLRIRINTLELAFGYTATLKSIRVRGLPSNELHFGISEAIEVMLLLLTILGALICDP